MSRHFRTYLQEQAQLHPSMQAQDVVKMCYQAAYGAEHLLTDMNAAFLWLKKEYEMIEVTEVSEKLYELLDDKTCRINLREWKRRKMPVEWLFHIFTESAVYAGKDGERDYATYMEEAGELIGQGVFSFSMQDWEETGKQGPVHHSELYRQQEKPAYRIVCTRYIRILPILEQLAKLPANEVHTIAIDGRCASGKTTMAGMLAKVLHAGVIHMDDFFLPPELRTPERFAQSGGNVHYERVCEEVLPHLKKAENFSYRRFDCSKMAIAEEVSVLGAKYYLVEGAYSCHPALGDYMSMKVFSDVEAKEQLERIRRRDGDKMLTSFQTRWIPMEEAYFDSLRQCKMQFEVKV